MKYCNVTLLKNKGKYRQWFWIIAMAVLFSVHKVHAQVGCSSLTPTFINYEPCKYRVQIVNISDCFTPTITVFIDANAFGTWSANTAGGWTGQEIAPNMVQLTHSSPFMPIGTSFPMIFTLPPGIITLGNFNWEYTCFPSESCTIFPGVELTSCPDPNDARIIGVKYRECGSSLYTNQTTIPGWPIQLLDVDGNVLREQVTDAAGAYTFYDLPLGNYTVKESDKPGWTSKVPLSGKYTVNLAPSQQVVRNFGNCPGCSCDSLFMDLTQVPGSADSCAYKLALTNSNNDACYQNLRISVASGSLSAVMPSVGWTASVLDSQHVQLNYAGGYIPVGFLELGKFRVSGASTQEITVSAVYNIGAGNVTCSRAFSYQCPPPTSPAPCCPAGSNFGNEQVLNSNFQQGNQDFTNSYPYFSPGGPSMIGKYSVLTQSQVYAANSQWACSDHTLLGGNMLIVDGYGGPIAWQQTVNVTAVTNYSYSAWFNNLVRPTKNYADPQMALFVGNTQIAGPLNLPENPDQWVRLCGTWTAMSSGPVVLSIRMLATTSIGNDVAIDDVSFKACIPPPSCVCVQSGAFSNMSYRPNSGPNVPINCGQIAFWQCNFPVFNLNGDFKCIGNSCPTMPPMLWTLNHPSLGQVNQGTASGTGFLISIPNASFTLPGLYTLTIAGICGMDTCYCDIIIETPGCGGSDCIEEFETGSTGQWATANGTISVITDPFTGSKVLKGNDNQGPSWMYNNSSDYNGDWTQKFNNCLCFDIRYDNGNPSNPGSGTGAITIYQGNDPLNFTKRATFVVNTPIGNTWTRICVPVGLSNGTAYPSNQYGQWTSTSLADFDMVMQGVSGIGIPLDFAGGPSPSEMVFVDNFCVEQCAGTACCADPLTFNNLIKQGFTVTQNGCTVTVTAPQFNNCYQFTTPPILNGENAQQIVTSATGSWTFNIPENGYHQICATVFDECNSQEMCASFKIDCHPPVIDTSCCAYSMYLVNKYTDNMHIKKVRVSGICGTEICCADPDEWVQVDGSPNYIEWFKDNLTGVPNGDAIDNDFIIYLKRSASTQNLEVEWFDAAGVVVCRHLLDLNCDMPYNEDDDWTLHTSTTALNDPNLLVFAARAPEEDDESDCEEAHEDRLTNACDVTFTATCSGGTDYVVSLSGPSGFDKYFWEVIYSPTGVTNPTINSVQNPTFTVKEGGVYIISLVAVTASKDTCTSEGDVDIPIIDPDFDALQLPCGYIGQFVAYGMDNASDVVSWSCPGYSSFPSSGNIVSFDFKGAASVSVTMTIKDKYDCTHEIMKQVNIVDCEAGVVVDKYCPDPCSNGTTNVTVHFKNLSKGGNCPILYTWDYGDGTSFSTSDPTAGETHPYQGLPCPLPVGGVNYTVTLTVQDAGTCSSTATTTVNISSCPANFTYKACPDGRVDFYGDEPGTWDFTGSIDIAKRPYSDKKDKDGRQKHVRVRYGSSGVYLVKYTPHCPNGAECGTLQEVVVVVDCCTKNHVTKRKEFANISGKDYKLKGKFRSTQFVQHHKIVAKTRMRKKLFKIGGHTCWVSSRDFAIIAEFDGKIYGREKADGCNCAFQVDIPTSGFPNHPIYGPWFVRKASVQEVWHKRKLHPRKDSITSTHTAEIDPVTLWQIKLQLGKECVRFHWWTDWY
jgi:hypothetical protein